MFSWRTKWSILKALYTKSSPYYIQFYINGVCNLKCKQCNIVETNSGIGELSIPQMQQVAENIRKIGGGIVLLTGGEPFLRRDVDEVAKAFLDEGLDVRLQTAGIASLDQLQRCHDVGAKDINISLDSLDPNKQDYINSVPGSWLKAIGAISRVGQVFSKGSAICSLGCVLSRFNFREIPAILEFATEIGWHLSLVPVHIADSSEEMGFRSYDGDFKFATSDIADLESLVETLVQMKRQGYQLFDSERFLWSSVEFLRTGTPTWRHEGVCDSPGLYFAIRPNGDFATCCDYVLDAPPSLLDAEFPRMYKDGTVRSAAKSTVESCAGCHYGSYPEVTISVRDRKAFAERAWTSLSRRPPVKSLSEESLLALVEDIKKRHPDAYSDTWLPEQTEQKLEMWKEPEQRRLLTIEDIATRKAEGRVRRRSLR
jgi:MoaA/NifB/PqqE/SkfB family radical SAM enzyme